MKENPRMDSKRFSKPSKEPVFPGMFKSEEETPEIKKKEKTEEETREGREKPGT